MLRNAYLIAAGAGFVSALAFISAMVGSAFTSSLLFVIAALPIYVAGVGWSWAAALLATSIGSLLLVLAGAKGAAMIFAGVIGMPAVLLTQLAEQRRTVSDGQGTTAVFWAPPGLLVILAAALSSIISVSIVSLMHEEMPKLRTEIEKFIKTTPQVSGQQELTAEQISQIVDTVVLVLPAAVAIVPMIAAVFNLWLAGRIVRAAGNLRRPWPDLAAMSFPRGTPLVLAAAGLFSSMLAGIGAIAAVAVFGAFFVAYLLLGLAVIHFITRGKPWRPFALWAVYIGLLLINVWVALPIILLGLADSIFSLRGRSSGLSGPST